MSKKTRHWVRFVRKKCPVSIVEWPLISSGFTSISCYGWYLNLNCKKMIRIDANLQSTIAFICMTAYIKEPMNRKVQRSLLPDDAEVWAINITPWMEVSLANSVNFSKRPILNAWSFSKQFLFLKIFQNFLVELLPRSLILWPL